MEVFVSRIESFLKSVEHSPLATIRTSSAKMKHVTKQARMTITQGFMMSATIITENEHPYGMPHAVVWELPIPPARQLWSSRYSKKWV